MGSAAERAKKKIKELMAAHGMSAYTLAQEADLTQNCISNWYGKRQYEPSLSSLEKVCAVFDISISELLCDEMDALVPIDEDFKQVLESWHQLTPQQKQAILLHIKSYSHQGLDK